MKFKRIFLLVLDSLGVGEANDADRFGDQGTSTLGHIIENYDLFIPNLKKLGFLDIPEMRENDKVEAYYTMARPKNAGKDSLSGHYEMVGIEANQAFASFPDGLPAELIERIEATTGRRVIGNVCGEGEEIIQELGEMQMNYGSLILFTSNNSTIQVAASENNIPVARLYEYCERIRKTLDDTNWNIGRVIARPFTGKVGHFHFVNSEQKDYALNPPSRSVLDALKDANLSVMTIGKVNDIFNGQGITKVIKAGNNMEAINKLTDLMDKSFTGLCFVNLGDFDKLGHKRDLEGYAKAIEELDVEIPMILNKLELDDLFIITADHGNDPTFVGRDHTRENVPVLFYSRSFLEPKRLPILETLADVGATVAENFEVFEPTIGTSILKELK